MMSLSYRFNALIYFKKKMIITEQSIQSRLSVDIVVGTLIVMDNSIVFGRLSEIVFPLP